MGATAETKLGTMNHELGCDLPHGLGLTAACQGMPGPGIQFPRGL